MITSEMFMDRSRKVASRHTESFLEADGTWSNMAASQVDDEILKPSSPVSFTASECSSDDESSDETLAMEEKPAAVATFMETLQPRMWSLVVLSALAFAFVPVTVCTAIVVLFARFAHCAGPGRLLR